MISDHQFPPSPPPLIPVITPTPTHPYFVLPLEESHPVNTNGQLNNHHQFPSCLHLDTPRPNPAPTPKPLDLRKNSEIVLDAPIDHVPDAPMDLSKSMPTTRYLTLLCFRINSRFLSN